MGRYKRVGLVVLFSITSVISLMAAIAATTSYIYAYNVSPRVYVAGEKIGNLSFPDARAKITAKASELSTKKLTLSLDNESVNVSPVDLGVKITTDQAFTESLNPPGTWDWLSVNHWRNFFQTKNVKLTYQADQATLRTDVEKTLNISTAAQDASLKVSNGQLSLVSAQKGHSIDVAVVDQALRELLSEGISQPAKLSYVETTPKVTDEEATQTKTEIENTLKPAQLTFGNQTYSLPVSAQLNLLSYEAKDGKLNWSISKQQLNDYLSVNIARKINIKMQPKTIMINTGEVTNNGLDGREVQLSKLTDDVYRTLTEHSDSPVTILTNTIPLTEKLVTPNYIAGLFPGLYIDVNLSVQRLYVLNGTEKVAEYLISSGKRGTPTPVGQFYIKNKIELARSPLYASLWMQKWNALATNPDGSGYKGYGLHKVPCFNSTCTLRESLSHLGRPASHGCVRIEDAGADWVYDNAPVGTPVNIHT